MIGGSARVAATLLVACLTCALLFGSSASGRAGSERPPPGHTGGFGEPTCQTCHFRADVNAGTGTLRVDGLPLAYEPGRKYALTVTVVQDGLGAAGFQMSSRFDDGSQAGSLAPVPADTPRVDVTTVLDVQYIHHVYAGTRRVAQDTARWSVVWKAPEGDGAVLFHVAANAADDDASPLGDLIYATALRISRAR